MGRRQEGALIITVGSPIADARDEMIGVLGLDIRFEDVVRAIRSEYEARGMQMSTKDLQKYQHLPGEVLHRSPRTAW